jgi:hypothetical protein
LLLRLFHFVFALPKPGWTLLMAGGRIHGRRELQYCPGPPWQLYISKPSFFDGKALSAFFGLARGDKDYTSEQSGGLRISRF